MLRLDNPVRHYAWGSTRALPELLGIEPDGRPHAEIWVGAHGAAPSVAMTAGTARPLDALVAEDPDALLGTAVREQFGDRLPYLVKLLAADRPLSLQVHPDAARARRRHAEERAAGVAAAADRRYPDPWHKPELLVALAPTLALAGLREPHDAADALDALGPGPAAVLAGVLGVLRAPGPAAPRLRAALGHALSLPRSAVEAVQVALGAEPPAALGAEPSAARGSEPSAARGSEPSPAVEPRDADPRRVARRLATHFPGDPGVVASFLLHAVVLRPGDGLAVGAGVLHCYVAGLGIEVMAASDNVLRAGLTPKTVDVVELLAVVDPEPGPAPVVRPRRVALADGVVAREYAAPGSAAPGSATPAPEFGLTVLDVDADDPVPVPTAGGPRTLVGLSGVVQVATRAGRCGVGAGESVLVPDAEGQLRLAGRGTVALVRVPAP